MLNRVERVTGSDINYLNYDQTQVENIEFGTILSLNQFIGFSTEPIPFVNFENVTISGLSTTFNGYSGLSIQELVLEPITLF